ncbi:MAG: ATP-binding protein [Chloroflexota bacterium]|nr:ATP-binding protein [Chloroflexota bacterium]
MLTDLNALLTLDPGNRLFALMFIALSIVLCAMALERRRAHSDDASLTRLFVLAWAYLGAGIAAIIGTALVTAGGASVDTLLPPLERAFTAGLIALSVWALAFNKGRFVTTGLLAILLSISVVYVLQSGEWAALAATSDFNTSGFIFIWTILSLILSLIGAAAVIVNAPGLRAVPLKTAVFVVMGAGQVGTLIMLAQGTLTGDDAGLVRLTMLIALALTIALVYRQVVTALQAASVAPVAPSNALPAPVLRPAIMTMPMPAPSTADRESAQLMRALGLMLENASPRLIPERVGEAVMNVMKADIAVMIRIRSANHAEIVWGRDRVMEKAIASNVINLDEQPTLVNAIERRQQRPLYPDRNIEELRELYSRLDLQSVGPTYIQPLVNDGEMPALLIVGLPYSRRELTDAERELLRGVAIIGAKLLGLSDAAHEVVESSAPVEAADDRFGALSAQLDAARAQVSDLTGQVGRLHTDLERERGRITATLDDDGDEESQSISQQMDALVEAEQQVVGERDRLAQRLRTAETALIGAVSTDNEAMLKSMIEVLDHERADLLAERDRLQAQINTLRSGAPIPSVVHDLLDRLSREKAELERDRQALHEKVTRIEDQLHALGVTDGANGLALLIQTLYEQRAALQVNYDQVKGERDRLLHQHAAEIASAQQDETREKQLKALQVQLSYLAADREAAINQRDRLRVERDELAAKQRTTQDRYARVMAEIAAYEQEVVELRGDQTEMKRRLEALQARRAASIGDGSLDVMLDAPLWAGARQSEESAAVLGMVQELRTPLTSVIGYVDLLLSETAGILGEMQRRFLSRVASNSSRLAHMLEDVARLVTLDADGANLISERINPVTLIEEAITHAAPQFRERNAVLNLDLDDAPPLIRGDKDAIGQIIGQLLANAYLASPHGGEIAISAHLGSADTPDADRFVIAVSDQGGGIDPNDMPRVFARRYRADNPLIQGVGDTGVGLAIAKTLIEAHGGRIWLETDPGIGTTFHVALPVESLRQPDELVVHQENN